MMGSGSGLGGVMCFVRLLLGADAALDWSHGGRTLTMLVGDMVVDSGIRRCLDGSGTLSLVLDSSGSGTE